MYRSCCHAIHISSTIQRIRQRSEYCRGSCWGGIHFHILSVIRRVFQLHSIHSRRRDVPSTSAWLWDWRRSILSKCFRHLDRPSYPLRIWCDYAFFLVETNNISWKKLQESLGTMLFLLIRLIPPLSRKEESRQQSTLKANGGIPAVSDSCYLNVNYIFQRCVLLKATQYVS